MIRWPIALLLLVGLAAGLCWRLNDLSGVARAKAETRQLGTLFAGFAEADITPAVGGKPVYMAGFGHNRLATGVHDPLKVRVVVLQHAEVKLALVSIDVIGFFQEYVVRVRSRLPGFTYVLVSSTHNHEGPDTLGLWGANPFKSGIDTDYLSFVEDRIVATVRSADAARRPVDARLGTAQAPELLFDARQPEVKHDTLVTLQFRDENNQPAGLLVQWNCHPETLESKNTQISADFVGATVRHLEDKFHCPVVYLTGTVGGLMTSMHVDLFDETGQPLASGSFEKTLRYGQEVGRLAERALARSKPLQLKPLEIHRREVYVPMENKMYQLGRRLGVLRRQAFLWTGDFTHAEPALEKETNLPLCVRTEVAWLRLGELDVAAIPGEIYPELVLGKVQDPADPGADYPEAPIEPSIYAQLRGPHRMLIGLANDELGYIIPKRQWDEKPPYCYGLKSSQYGEINSIGPDTAPILCTTFKEMVQAEK